MQFSRSDYTERIIDKAGKIPDNEPVFLIRGQDHIGHAAVRAWANLHRLNGGSDVVFTSAMEQADRMEAWAKKHGWPATMPTEDK